MSGLSAFYPLTAATPGLASSAHAGSVMHGLLNPYRCSCDLGIMSSILAAARLIGQPVFASCSTVRLHLTGVKSPGALVPANLAHLLAALVRPRLLCRFPGDLAPPVPIHQHAGPGGQDPSPFYTANTIRGTMTTCRRKTRVRSNSPSLPASCPSSAARGAPGSGPTTRPRPRPRPC